jgi:hypothetical protein
MLLPALTWVGIVLATGILLLMALGPVIVELDGWLARRKLARRARRVSAPATSRVGAATAAASAVAGSAVSGSVAAG